LEYENKGNRNVKQFFQKMKCDRRGVVVVMVTLLLIPAILITGTGVDMARIYAANSILHDANQLAANSALASYDALLQDLYGLFGIMSTDEVFADMMDTYIKATVFPEGAVSGAGNFQLFYGSDLSSGGITPAGDQNLANTEVLRRQIEEYAKFRAPAILVQEILDRLDTYKKISADAEAINDKMEIEDGLEDLEKVYRNIYDKINDLNNYDTFQSNMFYTINKTIDELKYELEEMYNARDDYESAKDDGDDDLADDYQEKYNGHISNIRAYINGGKVKTGYRLGGYNDNGNYVKGFWTETEEIRSSQGLRKRLQVYLSTIDDYKSKLDKLVNDGRSADSKKQELKRKVQELRNKLDSGQCSKELTDGLRPKLDEYENLFKYDIEPMCEAMRKTDMPLFDHTRILIEQVGYGDDSQGTTGTLRFMSVDRLGSMSENGDFAIDKGQNFDPNGSYRIDYLYEIISVTPRKYYSPGTFKKFDHKDFSTTHNPEFYQLLKELFSGSTNQNKNNAKKNIEQAMKKIQEYYTGLLEFNPEGAWKYSPGTQTQEGSEWTSGDWGKSGVAKSQVKDAMNSDLITKLGKGIGEAGNVLLLLTYDCEMFSCYTTNKRSENDKEVSMSGIPLGIDVNYFYQSELEYLFHGNEQSAQANLAVITGMIFLVRFVMDYVASFSIDSVNYVVNLVKASFSGLGPFAGVIGELARLAMALGEAAMDTSRLKYGDYVALFKTNANNSWKFTLNASAICGTMDDIIFSDDENSHDDDKNGLCYKDYMRLFLLLTNKDDLAYRTSRLIALNVTNKREGIGGKGNHFAREAAMSSAKLFDMSKCLTGFSITTTADLSMLFLSLPFAQEGVNGVIPPGTVELSVTDYRGY